MTDKTPQQLFNKFNDQYFNGRLPQYRVLITDQYGLGHHGMCRTKQQEIHLGTGLDGDKLVEVLLHEMCHANSHSGHGKTWLAEMKRLADMGAPTRKDWEAYQDRMQIMTSANIAEQAYDWGVESGQPWSKIRPVIGLEYGLTDANGRSESKGTARIMQRLRREFQKGRRFAKICEAARNGKV